MMKVIQPYTPTKTSHQHFVVLKCHILIILTFLQNEFAKIIWKDAIWCRYLVF